MQEKTTIVTGSIALIGGGYASAFVMFIISILFARYLEKDTFGVYLFVVSLAAMCYMFTDFGLDLLAGYFIQRYRDKRSDIGGTIMYLTIKIKLILTFIVIFILILLGFEDYRYWYVAVFFAVFAPNNYSRLFIDCFQHFRLSGQLQIIESILKLALVYFVLEYITTTQLSFIFIALMVPMSISAFFAARDILTALPKTHGVNLHELKHEAYHCWKWFAIGSILSPIVANIIQVTLGLSNEFSSLAIFGVGKTLSNVVLIFGTSIKSAIFPSFLKKTDSNDIGYSLTDSIRYMVIISIFLAFLIHFISSPLIILFYTAIYAESAIVFEILSYGILFSMVFLGLIPATFAASRPDLSVKVSVINLVVVVSLSTFLLPKFGTLGAAIALTSGLVAGTAAFAFVTSKILSYSFPWTTLIKCIIAALVILPLQFLELPPVYQIAVNAGIGSILYVLILYAIGEIKPADVRLFQESIKAITSYLNIRD